MSNSVPSADGELLGGATLAPSEETPTLQTKPDGYNHGNIGATFNSHANNNSGYSTQGEISHQEASNTLPSSDLNTKAVGEESFDATGDAALDASIKVLQKNGLTQSIVMEGMKDAVVSGDISKINKKVFIDKLGDTYGALAGVVAEQYFNHINNSASAAEHAIYEAAGGQQNWERYASTFKTNAPEYLQNIVKQQLESGNYQDVGRLVADFAKGSALVPVNNNILRPSIKVDVGLTKHQFLEEYEKLKEEATKNNDSLSDPRYYERLQVLHSRRSIGMRRDGK